MISFFNREILTVKLDFSFLGLRVFGFGSVNAIPKLIPADKKLRFETRRVTSWFDDKFYNEVTKNLLNERVYKKIFKIGQPDSGAIKEGLKKIKFHFDYLEWLLEKRNWSPTVIYFSLKKFAFRNHKARKRRIKKSK